MWKGSSLARKGRVRVRVRIRVRGRGRGRIRVRVRASLARKARVVLPPHTTKKGNGPSPVPQDTT